MKGLIKKNRKRILTFVRTIQGSSDVRRRGIKLVVQPIRVHS